VPGGTTVWDTLKRGAMTVGFVDDSGVVKTSENTKSDFTQAEAAAAESQAKETGGSKKKTKKTTKAKGKGKKEEKEVPGIGVRRRYYFTSKGVRISNLIVT
jgi:hypothetical protein